MTLGFLEPVEILVVGETVQATINPDRCASARIAYELAIYQQLSEG